MCDKSVDLWWTKPCPCNNGWGEFETLDDLLDTIDEEIGAAERGRRYRPDEEAVWLMEQVQDLADEGLTLNEIARMLGIRPREVRAYLQAGEVCLRI